MVEFWQVWAIVLVVAHAGEDQGKRFRILRMAICRHGDRDLV